MNISKILILFYMHVYISSPPFSLTTCMYLHIYSVMILKGTNKQNLTVQEIL